MRPELWSLTAMRLLSQVLAAVDNACVIAHGKGGETGNQRRRTAPEAPGYGYGRNPEETDGI